MSVEDKPSEIAALIDNLDDCLDRLFLSGFGTAIEAGIQELRALSEACTSFGLSFAAASLVHMADVWEQKRHSFTYDCSELVQSLCCLDLYVSSVRSKLQVDSISATMTR